ncbi:MAG: hypothetical protein NZ700_10430 [Gemmataceae bacterium]|nr:hypothetical protein [Gemmataceae bacterium]MDW8266926.1 hypothetical protein [Gemmataceae bacterium]
MAASSPIPGPLKGTLHVHVAYDWGDEVDLELAQRLVPSEVRALQRRRRTPSSIDYRPAPLRLPLAPVTLRLPFLGPVQTEGAVTLFDFGAASVSIPVPFDLPPDRLTQLAAALADLDELAWDVRQTVEPLYRLMLPAIHDATWSDLREEYVVFQLPPGESGPVPEDLLHTHASWLAGLLRLEAAALSADEVAEAVRLRLSYGPGDLFIADWAAAVLIDADCAETLQVIEFANLQLLELRHIDNRLDDRLAAARGLIQPLTRSWLPFWRTHARPLRALGELKAEAEGLFERTENVLKLVGDQYLARVYRILATRFHTEAWQRSIQRKLQVVEGIYQMVSDQAATYRIEALEIIIVLLILIEVVLGFVRH